MTTRHLAVIIGVVGVVCTAPVTLAQQAPGEPSQPRMMLAMDSLDRRLDSLVDRMNHTRGDQKVAAMAAVINELVAQRKVMHGHMQQMMDEKSGMGRMGPPIDTTPPRVPASGR